MSFCFRLLTLYIRHMKTVCNKYYSQNSESIKPKFKIPAIFKWKPIGRYVSGSPLLDIASYFRARAGIADPALVYLT